METAAQTGGESILSTMKFAVLPIAKVFTICFLGYLMAIKSINILPASGRKLLNGLVFSLLLPCLIFSQLGRAVTIQKMRDWWFIPVNVVLGSISGSLIGLIVASIVRPPSPYFKFTIIKIGIGNIGNIPLVLIAALCPDKSNPFGDTEKCTEAGNAYISFGQWVGAIILYTYVFKMLGPSEGSSDSKEETKLPSKATPQNCPPEQVPFLPSSEPQLVDTISSNRGKARKADLYKLLDLFLLVGNVYVHSGCSFATHMSNPLNAMAVEIQAALCFLADKLKIKQIMQPPILASILALVIGVTPFLKHLILTDDGPLFFLTDSCIILGDAMIPCILLALGGNLVDGPGSGSAKLGLRTTVAIIFARLVLVPPAGLGIVMLADKLGFLPRGDKMFKFVLLLQHSMPTSVLSGAVANLRGCGSESAAILFWVHIFAFFSMTVWIGLYLTILF